MTPADTARVLLDTNAFVSAIKHPVRETKTLRLIATLLARDNIQLVGNDLLAREYLRYAQLFPSPTASALAAAILETMEVVRVEPRFLSACQPYFRPGSIADCVHAATCLQTGAVLVSNDKDFDPIRKARVIEVYPVSGALRRWSPAGE